MLAGVMAMLEHYAEHPAVARACTVEVLRAAQASRTAADKARRRWVRHVAAAARADGAAVPDLHFELLAGALDQGVLQRVTAEDPEPLTALRGRAAAVAELFEPIAA